MINCIDCIWAIQYDEDKQCIRASPEIKECKWYRSAERKLVRRRKAMEELKEYIKELKNEYEYHSKDILKKLLDEGYELSSTIGLIEKIINYEGEEK